MINRELSEQNALLIEAQQRWKNDTKQTTTPQARQSAIQGRNEEIQKIQGRISELQKKLTQTQQFTLSLSINITSGILSLQAGSLTASQGRSLIPDAIERIVARIRATFTPETPDAAVHNLANSTIEKINAIELQVSTTRHKANEVQQQLAEVSVLLPSIADVFRRAKEAQSSVEELEEQAVRLRRTMETENVKFGELQQHIVAKRSEVTNTIADVQETTAQSNRLISQHKRAIEDSKSKIENYLSDLKLKSEAADQHLATTGSKLKESEQFIKTKRTDIESAIQSVHNDFKERATNWDEKFKSVLDEANRKREQIHQVLGFAVGTSLSKAFNARQHDLEYGKALWVIGILVVTSALTYTSSLMVESSLHGEGGSLMQNWIFRVVTLLPLVVLDLFFIGQFKRTTLLADQYAFKAAIASSFDYYKEELGKGLQVSGAMASFIEQTIGRLWSEPNHVTELSPTEMRKLTRLIEKLGVAALKEGSAITQAALANRKTPEPAPSTQKESSS